MLQKTSQLSVKFDRVFRLALAVLLCALPLVLSQTTSAAQLTSRSVELGSATPSGVTTYRFGFVPPTAAPIQGLKFQACTTALGTCNAPAGLSFSSAVASTLTGWTNGTAFTAGAGASDCVASASILCANRTQAANETGTGIRYILFTTVTNPNGTGGTCGATTNCTFFVRATTYNLNTYTAGSIVDTGTVANSTTQQLTVNATIQETLSFCVGSTTVDNATTSIGDCSTISGTSVNLGTLTDTKVSITPVPSGNAGDNNNGIAQISTNATTGVGVNYESVQQSGGSTYLGSLRVAGNACNASPVVTDQCINSQTAKSTLVEGTEEFGMTIAGVNCVATTAYTCSFAGGTYKMTRDTNYSGAGTNTYPTTDANQIDGTTTSQYAWKDDGTITNIAQSTSGVDRESLILKFAATPNLITPTGAYTARADFIALPVY